MSEVGVFDTFLALRHDEISSFQADYAAAHAPQGRTRIQENSLQHDQRPQANNYSLFHAAMPHARTLKLDHGANGAGDLGII
jgi:hypothetical protein